MAFAKLIKLIQLACVIVAADKAVVGETETVNVVALVIAVTVVPAEKTPVALSEVTAISCPTVNPAVLVQVIVAPELLAFVAETAPIV
jgi:hypothetical protein